MSSLDNDGANSGRIGSATDQNGEITAGLLAIPHITVQAFCENPQTAELIEAAMMDRRMSKVATTTHNGGMQAAIEIYRANPTPNLVFIESTLAAEDLMRELGQLADVCDGSTRVIVLGHINDVVLYRELIRSGVSEYLVLPIQSGAIVSAIADLFVSEDADPIGRSVGFVSAKGGAGSSTAAHNVAWMTAQTLGQEVLIVDMDLAFGTLGLNFNQDPPHGLGDAAFAHEKVDSVMLDRLMSKAASNVSLLTAPGTLDKTYDFSETDFEQIIEMAQSTVPLVMLDIPHMWDGWVRNTLCSLDEVVIVAEPDLANLRNAKALVDTIRAARPADADPMLVLNKVGVPKRPEISAPEFAAALDIALIGQIPFDSALFGTAANNGQMISEVAANNKINETYRDIGMRVSGRKVADAEPGKGGFALSDIFKKLKRA